MLKYTTQTVKRVSIEIIWSVPFIIHMHTHAHIHTQISKKRGKL